MMLLKIIMFLMVVFAIISIQTQKLRRAIIYMGIFSLISSFCYLLYHAPDVAIAEAIIGSTLATILYLVALQKYRVFTIYYTDENLSSVNDQYIIKGRENILNLVEQFFIIKELEPQVIYTTDTFNDLKANYSYDLIIRQKKKGIYIYSNHKHNYQFGALKNFLVSKTDQPIIFVEIHEEREYIS